MHELIGFKDGRAVYATREVIAVHGLASLRRELCDLILFPVRTSLSDNDYNTIMVEARSQEEAVKKYLESKQYKQE